MLILLLFYHPLFITHCIYISVNSWSSSHVSCIVCLVSTIFSQYLVFIYRIVCSIYLVSIYDVLPWSTEVLTDGLPLLFGAPFSIEHCRLCYHFHYVHSFANKYMDGWMDGWMDG